MSTTPRAKPMPTSEDKPATQFSEAELSENPSEVKLQDLEQHISNRINQLSDTTCPTTTENLELAAASDLLDELPRGEGFTPEFEAFEAFSFNSLSSNQERFRSSYQEISSTYQGNEDLIKGMNDLSDLIADSVRQLNIRLNALEERVAELSEASTPDLPKNIKEIRAILVKLYQKGLPSGDGESSKKDSASEQSNLVFEINQQFRALETRLDGLISDIKQKSDERNKELRGEIANKAKELEKFLREIRDYLNRHFFNLAVLLIVILFIAGVLITNSLDRMANFVTHSMDELRIHFDQFALPPFNSGQPPPTK